MPLKSVQNQMEAKSMKQILILIGWLLIGLLVACTPTNEPVSVTRPIEATAVSPVTPTPPPTISTTQGWITFQNNYFQISHPADAILTIEGDCLQIYYKAGYVTVSTPPPGGQAPLCDPTQLEGYDLTEINGRTRIGDIPYLTSGNELYEPETANWVGEALGVTIDENATLITYGTAQNQGYTQEDYEASKVVLMEIINSYQRLETAVSVPTPLPPTPVQETAVPAPTQLAVCATGLEAESVAAPTGPLRVSYSSGNTAGVWREEWNMVQLFPLPADATNALITADSEHVVFSRHPDDDTTEIWVMDTDGNARKLASASKSAYLQNQPEYVIDATLSYRWLGSSHELAYAWSPEFDGLGGELPYDTVTVVTAETGNPRVVITPGETVGYKSSPDGSQIAAFTPNELRLIYTADGSIQHTLLLDGIKTADYSKDGRYLVLFIPNAIAIVDTLDGTHRQIPLAYTPIGMGHHSVSPGVIWQEANTSFYTIVPNSTDFSQAIDPSATFTIWQIDLPTATATPLNTFTGFAIEARLSPNAHYAVFWTQTPDNNRTLYLADVLTGETVVYETGSTLELFGWLPDNTHFLFKLTNSSEPQLGHLCAPPTSQDNISQKVVWVDAQRFLQLHSISGDDINGEWEIRLRSLDGQDTLVTAFTGPYPSFHFSFATDPSQP